MDDLDRRLDPSKAADIAEFSALLADLVASAGAPAHRDLARRVGPMLRPPRVVSKSTVSELLRPGRRRLNLDLVVAIVRVLGLDEPAVDRWRRACIRVQAEGKTGGPVGVFRQLPADLATFTGREAAVGQLIESATAPADPERAATVVISAVEGMAGVGKTQLAVHAAHALVRSGRFGDIQLYVNLRGYDLDRPPADPAAVLEAFLRQLEVPARQIPRSLDERSAMFRDRVHGKHALLLLDNASDVRQVSPLLPASSSCLVLVTSRRKLVGLDGAAFQHLDVFTPDEAVSLLARIAGQRRIADEPAAAARIAEQCGRLPFAIALAASRLRARPALSLSHLASRLDAGGIDILASRGPALGELLELSYRGLPDAARLGFRLLGLFPGRGFTVPAFAALAGISSGAAEATLELLLDEHLLQQKTAGRFEMHDLVHRFAVEVAADLPGEVRGPAVERLALWHLCSVVGASTAMASRDRPIALPDRPAGLEPLAFATNGEALAWLDAEHENLCACLSLAADYGCHEIVWKTAFALRNYQLLRRQFDAWIACYDLALRAAVQAGDEPAQARALNGQCSAFGHAGRLHEAVGYARRSIAIYRRLGDQEGQSIALNNLGIALDRLGRFSESVRVYEQAVTISQAAGDSVNEGIALMNAAEGYARTSGRDRAMSACLRALTILRAAGHSRAEAALMDTLAELHHSAGQLDDAASAYQRVVELARQVGDVHLQAAELRALGTVLAEAGQLADARAAWTESALLYRSLELPCAAYGRTAAPSCGSSV